MDTKGKRVIVIETYYLIDYENVHEEGLVGCDSLKKTDHIVIFFTPNAMRIDMRGISDHGQASLDMKEVPAGKQSADIHISSYAGMLIGESQNKIKIIIISKDKVYEYLTEFWKKRAEIIRREKIDVPKPAVKQTKAEPAKPKKEETSTSSKAKAATKAEIKTQLNKDIQKALSKKGDYDNKIIGNVAKIVVKHYGEENFKRDIYNALHSEYKKKYEEIYKVIKPILTKYS